MSSIWQRLEFWIIMVVVAVLKAKTSPDLNKWQIGGSIIIALGSAIVFTDPLLHWFEMDLPTYQAPVAGLVALTAEHTARQVLSVSWVDFIKLSRGNSK